MKKIVTLLMAFVLLFSTAFTTFGQANDYEDSWAKEAIHYMKEKEIIIGYTDGTFRPDNPMIKVEFYTIINRLLGFTEKAEIHFEDVHSSSWYYEEVQKAVKANYISADGKLNGEENITRGEVAEILSIVYKVEQDEEIAKEFADYDTIADELKGIVGGLKKNSFITGFPDKTFRPEAKITRAEIATMLHNIIEKTIEEVTDEIKEEAGEEPKKENTEQEPTEETDKPSEASIISTYRSQLLSLQSSAVSSLDSLVAQAQSELDEGIAPSIVYNKYEPMARSLEASTDSEVSSILSGLEAELIANGYDTGAVSSLYSEYEQAKSSYSINITLP